MTASHVPLRAEALELGTGLCGRDSPGPHQATPPRSVGYEDDLPGAGRPVLEGREGRVALSEGQLLGVPCREVRRVSLGAGAEWGRCLAWVCQQGEGLRGQGIREERGSSARSREVWGEGRGEGAAIREGRRRRFSEERASERRAVSRGFRERGSSLGLRGAQGLREGKGPLGGL